jgi:hypothetical protein
MLYRPAKPCVLANAALARKGVKTSGVQHFRYTNLLSRVVLHRDNFIHSHALIVQDGPLASLFGVSWSHTYRHTVGLLWTSDQPVAEACTYTEQHFMHSFTGSYSPGWTFALPFRGFLITHIQTHGRTTLDEWSARRRGLYLHRTTFHSFIYRVL